MITEDFMAMIKSRFRALQQTVPLEDDFAQYLATQCADGSWPDIDYAGSVAWTPWLHVNRLAQLARVYTREGHRLAGAPAVLQVIFRGIDHWLHHRYELADWWYNSIGVPCEMVAVVMLLDADLGSERRDGVLSILDQAGVPVKSSEGTTWLAHRDQDQCYASGVKVGANMNWLARIVFHRAFLRRDSHGVAESVRLLWDIVQVGTAEGIQADGSYYLHGARLQNFHYGLAHLESVCELAWLLRDTPFALPDEKRQIISWYLLEGSRWMCRGAMTVPGTLDRATTRLDVFRVKELSRLLTLWREVAPEVADDVSAFLVSQSDGTAAVQGFRFFPRGDFSAYHHPRFSLFVKTVSTRTELSESINGENLRGVPYLNCGDHYLLQHGDEYYNLPPVWEWRSLPGLTMSSQPSLPIRMPYVGGVGNGQSGCAVMQYARQETTRPFAWSLRKFWVFHHDMMICLLGGWQLPSEIDELTTSLEQCRRRGPIHVATANVVQALADGDHHLAGVHWVLHRQVGYLPISPASLRINLAEVTGTWQQINEEYVQEPPVTEQCFLLQMRHLRPVTGAGFVLVGGADAERLDILSSDPPWTILANDETQQSLRFADDTTMAACYAPGVVIERGEELLRVNRPCLALWTTTDLWLSDPSWTGGQVHVTWQGEQHVVELPCDGQTINLNKT